MCVGGDGVCGCDFHAKLMSGSIELYIHILSEMVREVDTHLRKRQRVGSRTLAAIEVTQDVLISARKGLNASTPEVSEMSMTWV